MKIKSYEKGNKIEKFQNSGSISKWKFPESYEWLYLNPNIPTSEEMAEWTRKYYEVTKDLGEFLDGYKKVQNNSNNFMEEHPDYYDKELEWENLYNSEYSKLTDGLDEFIEGLNNSETPTLYKNMYWFRHPELRDKITAYEEGIEKLYQRRSSEYPDVYKYRTQVDPDLFAEKYYSTHPELQDKLLAYKNHMMELFNMDDSKKKTLGDIPGYTELYNQHQLDKLKKSIQNTTEDFSRNMYNMIHQNGRYSDEDKQFMEDYSNGKVLGPLTGNQKYLAEDVESNARINARMYADQLNQKLGTNYSWQDADNITKLLEAAESERDPNYVQDVMKWAPTAAGVFGSSNLYDNLVQSELESRPSNIKFKNQYPEAYKMYVDDPYRALQLQKAITQGSIALGTAAGVGIGALSRFLTPMLQSAGMNVASSLGNGILARAAGDMVAHPISTALSGYSAYNAVDNVTKGKYKDAAIEAGFALSPFLRGVGGFLRTPSMGLKFANAGKYTASSVPELENILYKVAGSGDKLTSLRTFNPSTYTRIMGKVLPELPNFTLGANSAYNLYNDNYKSNLDSKELTRRNIENGINLGMTTILPAFSHFRRKYPEINLKSKFGSGETDYNVSNFKRTGYDYDIDANYYKSWRTPSQSSGAFQSTFKPRTSLDGDIDFNYYGLGNPTTIMPGSKPTNIRYDYDIDNIYKYSSK